MLLKDFFVTLSHIEFSSLSLGSNGAGSIDGSQANRVVSCINEALAGISTKFVLREKELIIQTFDWKTKYPLRKEYAVTDPTEVSHKYIMDTPNNPYKGDLVKILSVFNEIGQELPINDSDQYASVFIPEYDILEIMHPSDDNAFSVIYQCPLDPLFYNDGSNNEEFMDQILRIPFALRGAFRSLVGYHLFSSMGGQEFGQIAQNFMMRYEQLCFEVESKNSLGDTAISTGTKLEARGFV